MTATIRTLVATGASSGLGFETLKQLLTSPPKDTSYRVILGARDPIKASQAYDNLDNEKSTNRITCHPLDLANLKSVQAFGRKVRQDLGDKLIDTLFIAGGIVKPAARETQYAGYSEAYMVNHLSQHYLLHLLQDKLSPGSSRIVFVSSMKLKEVKDPESLQDMLSSDSQSPAIKIYQATKFVQLLSALHWRRKLQGKAEVIAVSPGFVPSSGLSRNTEYGYLGRLVMYYLVSLLPFATSLQDGGTAILRAITGEYTLKDEDHMLLNNKGDFEKLDIKLLDYDLQEKWCPSRAEIEERFEA